MPLEVIVPVARSRYVIVHYHLFKNAGTTIEHVLNREFPGAFATLHGETPDSTLDASDLLELLDRRPSINAVSSHHLRYPKPASRRVIFFDCCFLRDPLARLYSCYQHFRRSGSNDSCCQLARASSPREFMRRLIDEAPHLVSDVQVTNLASAGAFTRRADDHDLDRASGVVREMAFPGLVEMFDESMVVAEYYLRPAFPHLRLEYVPQNVGVPPAGNPEEIWGAALSETLLEMNALDLELIRRTKYEIQRRSALVPQFARKLAAFRSRCAGRAEEKPLVMSAGC